MLNRMLVKSSFATTAPRSRAAQEPALITDGPDLAPGRLGSRFQALVAPRPIAWLSTLEPHRYLLRLVGKAGDDQGVCPGDTVSLVKPTTKDPLQIADRALTTRDRVATASGCADDRRVTLDLVGSLSRDRAVAAR
jgi:hypothetical protein